MLSCTCAPICKRRGPRHSKGPQRARALTCSSWAPSRRPLARIMSRRGRCQGCAPPPSVAASGLHNTNPLEFGQAAQRSAAAPTLGLANLMAMALGSRHSSPRTQHRRRNGPPLNVAASPRSRVSAAVPRTTPRSYGLPSLMLPSRRPRRGRRQAPPCQPPGDTFPSFPATRAEEPASFTGDPA